MFAGLIIIVAMKKMKIKRMNARRKSTRKDHAPIAELHRREPRTLKS
jgi:hypothetical protein